MLPGDSTEDELSTSESTESEQQYYNDNNYLPVFRNGLSNMWTIHKRDCFYP